MSSLLRPPTEPEFLPEGCLPCDRVREDNVVVHSLTGHALQELERHKWIESQKHGHDVGAFAYQHWLDHCWKGWTRAKLLEHLYGWRCWGAFDEDDFGLFAQSTVDHHVSSEVLEQVAEILANGGENLDVINWAVEVNADIAAIMWLLDRIDINAKRQRLLTNHIRLFI
ncbi:MAG: hypothetical protein EA402_11180 [Planctomycetota bacterium]|nr:MAG: hypothetical protein EA402_11180 [Planctomycetota bacterium]